MADNSKLTGAEFFRKYADIIAEAQVPAKTPAEIESEFQALVANKGGWTVKQPSPESMNKYNAYLAQQGQAGKANRVTQAQQDAQVAAYRDPLAKEKGLADIQRQNNKAATDNMSDVMFKANNNNLDSNQLGQIGQMSSAFQPAAGNYQGKPGDVQLIQQKQAKSTTLPAGTLPAGAKQMKPYTR